MKFSSIVSSLMFVVDDFNALIQLGIIVQKQVLVILCFGKGTIVIFLFPYEYAILLMCTGFGLMDNKLLIKALCLRTLGAFGILFLVSIPYGYLIGLFA